MGEHRQAFADLAALALAAALTMGGLASATGLDGSTVHAVYYYPNLATIDPSAGDDQTVPIQEGTEFTFSDPNYGVFMNVAFFGDQIVLTNLVPGQYPYGDAVGGFDGFQLIFSGVDITSVTEDATYSSPLFAPGSVLTFTDNSILLDLSGTCDACVGASHGQGGENIVLDVTTAAPEPSTWPSHVRRDRRRRTDAATRQAQVGSSAQRGLCGLIFDTGKETVRMVIGGGGARR